jgi:hypothetical protein
MYHSDAARVERKTIIFLSGVTQDDEEEQHTQPSSSVESFWSEHDSRINELNDKARSPKSNVRAKALNLILEYKQMPHLNRKYDRLHFWHSKADHSLLKNYAPLI